MELQIVFSVNQPKYVAIYEQLKEKIMLKELAAHAKLPSKRQLALQLNISIQTVQIAYEQLLSEGYLSSFSRKHSPLQVGDECLFYKIQPVFQTPTE